MHGRLASNCDGGLAGRLGSFTKIGSPEFFAITLTNAGSLASGDLDRTPLPAALETRYQHANYASLSPKNLPEFGVGLSTFRHY